MSKKVLCGTVISSKSNKTIMVSILSVARDRLYKKVVRRCKKYSVHNPYVDEFCNPYKEGDLVKIQEYRPISSTKKWIVFKEEMC
ncbi:MAG: 30S ribosomal protein S17 [Candidatus Mesenet longicola]|uniref:Small ribosomal subunit protein uS17 n=1 Tax=Candidatus Mesenet longicola TaxID=1892558 RepID=A0A8J3HUA3_9RICK|nr:MAG: 30S ribosomal protein S17 [Candidatus Mesenet longicola]GHM59159.1 MAG: 30S ribosomal protein S17 [Candidatus Mesenet longicola]